MSRGTCSIEGCAKPHKGRGYCHPHYELWRRYGVPQPMSRQADRIAERFWAKVDRGKPEQCWIWSGTLEDGYGRFSMFGRYGRAYRASWIITNGPIPDGLLVRHKCDVRACVNPRHLELGTQADNMRDMAERGGTAGRKLTDAQVFEIRNFYASGVSILQLRLAYGVSRTLIYNIVAGSVWTHVDGPTFENQRGNA